MHPAQGTSDGPGGHSPCRQQGDLHGGQDAGCSVGAPAGVSYHHPRAFCATMSRGPGVQQNPSRGRRHTRPPRREAGTETTAQLTSPKENTQSGAARGQPHPEPGHSPPIPSPGSWATGPHGLTGISPAPASGPPAQPLPSPSVHQVTAQRPLLQEAHRDYSRAPAHIPQLLPLDPPSSPRLAGHEGQCAGGRWPPGGRSRALLPRQEKGPDPAARAGACCHEAPSQGITTPREESQAPRGRAGGARPQGTGEPALRAPWHSRRAALFAVPEPQMEPAGPRGYVRWAHSAGHPRCRAPPVPQP